MDIAALSDLHGTLPIEFKPVELVCICGDIMPLNIQANSRKTKKWLKEIFKPWAENLPCNKVVFIGGNHDHYFKDLDFMYSLFPKIGKITYLFHELYEYQSLEGNIIRIFGTPFCKLFGNWAFMENEETLTALYQDIPNNLDILLTHDQPFGYGDILLQEKLSWTPIEHIGNKPLTEAILAKQPKIQCNGHLHSCEHGEIKIYTTRHYNVSIKDELYNWEYPITYIKL